MASSSFLGVNVQDEGSCFAVCPLCSSEGASGLSKKNLFGFLQLAEELSRG